MLTYSGHPRRKRLFSLGTEVNELCVRCGKPTPYDINTPITVRLYYIEGAGQLCEACWRKMYDNDRDREIDPENELYTSQW